MRVKVRAALGVLAASVVAGASLFAAPASAFSSVQSPFTDAVDFITGFSGSAVCNNPQGGPIGLLEDASNWYVADPCNTTLYRVPTSGGSITTAAASANGMATGLAISNDNAHYYGLANSFTNNPTLVEFDPSSLAVKRTVAPMVVGSTSCRPLDVITDPLTTDLYVSGQSCGLLKVTNPAGANPTVTTVFSYPANFNYFDGLAWSNDGSTLWAANSQGGYVESFARAATLTPGKQISVFRPDGMVFVRSTGRSDLVGKFFVNSNDGVVHMIDPQAGTQTQVATGGTRGDFAQLGLDGCLYVTQSDRIQKLEPCLLAAAGAPPAPAPAAPAAPAPPAPVPTPTLPHTGANSAPLAGLAMALLMVGAAALILGRPPRPIHVWWTTG